MKFQKGHKINVGNKHHLGFKHSDEAKSKIGEKSKGRKAWNTGIPWPEEIKERISQTNKLKGIEPKIKYIGNGDKHWNWQGGISCEPYCEVWTDKEYKDWIKYERDNGECQNPLCKGNYKRLNLHHINYNKKDCRPNNLITLCCSCNAKANFNREWYISYYTELMKSLTGETQR